MLLRINFKPVSCFSSFPKAHTFFGAFCHGLKMLFGEQALLEFLRAYEKEPPLLFSTTLPYKEDRLFFPKPQLKYGNHEPESIERYKEFKRIKKMGYVSEEVFKEVLEGRLKTYEDLLKKKAEGVKPYEDFLMPHASINRITSTTEGGEFFSERVYTLSSFACLVRVKDSFRQMAKGWGVEDMGLFLQRAFELVGLGGNRSCGMGWSKVEVEEEKGWIKDHMEKGGSKFITLSETFYDRAFILEKSLYDLEVLKPAVEKGYADSLPVVWKRKLLMLKAGSVLRVEKKDYYGSLKKVVEYENARIYHYGLAFPMYMEEGS